MPTHISGLPQAALAISEAAIQAHSRIRSNRSKGAVVVGIDGRSGAGKSTLSSLISPILTAHGLRCAWVELERFIEGWEGLVAGTRHVAKKMLGPMRTRGWACLTEWDWHSMQWASNVRIPESGKLDVLLLTGCGATSMSCSPHLSVAVWVQAPQEVRRRRVQKREEGSDQWWDTWSAQEDILLEEKDSFADADILVFSSGLTVNAPFSR